MVTIIAGSRAIESYSLLCAVIRHCGIPITKVISGMAPGIDRLAVRWTIEHLGKDKLIEMAADWTGYPAVRNQGHIRNQAMADHPEVEAALIINLNGSSGSKDMERRAEKRGLLVSVWELNT